MPCDSKLVLCFRGKFATVYQCERKDTKEKYAAKIIQTKSQKNMEESLNEVSYLIRHVVAQGPSEVSCIGCK